MRIRAAVLHEYGTPLEICALELDPPGPGEVLVRVVAAGVCHSDLHLADGHLGAGRHPIVLGHEGAGVVAEVGEGVRHVAPGDPVAFCFVPSCGTCSACAAGRRNLCEIASDRAWAGTLLDGTSRLRFPDGAPLQHFNFVSCFASHCVVPAGSAVPVPAVLPLWQAALLGCGVVTAVGAVRNAARVAVGETVCVIGCGGIGQQLVAAARLAGAGQVIAVERDAAKRALALERGATHAVAADGDAAATAAAVLALAPGGVDHAFEAVGSPTTIRLAWDVLRPGAFATVVGIAPAGVEVALPALELLSEKGIRGSYYGSGDAAALLASMAEMTAAGRFSVADVVTHTTDLDGIEAAFERLRRGEGARTVALIDPEAAGWAHLTEVVSIDPYRGDRFFSAAAAGPDVVAAAVARAVAAQPAWAARPVAERAAVLDAFAAAVEADAERLAELLVREVGKRRADADGEVAWTARSARYYAAHPPAEELVGGARVVRRPLGVVAAITPWNVPLITPAWKWLPALVAGNAVVWKPSERATATALAAADLLHGAGVPDAILAVAPGGPETARALAADERVAGLHFTGSEPAGRALAALAAPRFARVALELSGLNPAIVLADADLDLAADCIVACATALAGQKCTSTRRVLVEDAVAEPLVARLAERIAGLRVGDPRDRGTDVGPLIGADARAAAEAEIERARAAGARVLARARPPAGDALFGPVLLGELAADDPLRARELFAPVLSVDTFATPEQAWEQANAAPYGLSAAVYGRDPERLAQATALVRSGVLAVNRRGDDVGLEPPFAGRGHSGNGQAEGGTYAYAALTDLQTVYT